MFADEVNVDGADGDLAFVTGVEGEGEAEEDEAKLESASHTNGSCGRGR